MRKITNKEKYAKKQKRNQLILGLGLVFVMLMSVIGYGFVGRPSEDNNSAEKIVVNGVEFVNTNGLYGTELGGVQVVLSNNPKEVYQIEENIHYANSYTGLPLYVSSNNDLATREIYSTYIQIAQRIQNACLINDTTIECEENFPTKDCTNNFIIIRKSNETSVVQEDNCLFISGPSENLINITDGFLLKSLGIAN